MIRELCCKQAVVEFFFSPDESLPIEGFGVKKKREAEKQKKKKKKAPQVYPAEKKKKKKIQTEWSSR